jgi:hypothetical protein
MEIIAASVPKHVTGFAPPNYPAIWGRGLILSRRQQRSFNRNEALTPPDFRGLRSHPRLDFTSKQPRGSPP